jgi:uncharacterized membrane protein/uncharacterized protein YhjY with autotransporter beta-barrel domain
MDPFPPSLSHPTFVPTSVSGDGSVTVGNYTAGPPDIAAWWDANGDAHELPMPVDGTTSFASDVDFDGSTIVGGYYTSGDGHALRWTDGVVEVLDSLPGGHYERANAVSADGSIVVGAGQTSQGFGLAVWWDANGAVTVLDYYHDQVASLAVDVSADGSIAVGLGREGAFANKGVRWDIAANTFIELESLSADPYADVYVKAISDDGLVIVGNAINDSVQTQAVRWNAQNEITALAYLRPFHTSASANAVSADGSIVVGRSGAEAVRWLESGDVESILTWLTGAGVDMAGWDLSEASGVSDDGRTIVGQGRFNIDYVGWIARDRGLITTEGAMESLASLGAVSQGAQNFMGGLLAGQQEFALQHAVTAYVPEPRGYAADPGASFPNIKRTPDYLRWRVFGYAEGYAGSDPESAQGLGQIGASYTAAENLIVGGSLGFGGGTTDMAFEGEADFLGLSGSAFAAYVPRTGFQAVLSVTASGLDADISRGYLNGAGLDTSDGETDGAGFGAALRVGYAFDLTPATSLTPFGTVQAVRVDLDGYTETTGPFPAVIGEIEDTATIGKLGVEARHALTDLTWIWGSAAWAHRADDEGAEVDAELIGLFGISGARMPLDQDWAEVTGGVSHGFADGVSRLTGSVTLYVPGEDVSATGRVGYSRAF